jgi:hypothetical protein
MDAITLVNGTTRRYVFGSRHGCLRHVDYSANCSCCILADDLQDGEEDVRIATKRLVKFRLCPTDMCDNNKGCNSGYGGTKGCCTGMSCESAVAQIRLLVCRLHCGHGNFSVRMDGIEGGVPVVQMRLLEELRLQLRRSKRELFARHVPLRLLQGKSTQIALLTSLDH